MRVLFDQGTPVPLRESLPQHVVETAYERGWVAAIDAARAETYTEVEVP